MAKRFTDTNKYKKPFTRGLQGAYKLLWDYLYHDCDHAGIWIVDFEIAQTYIGSDMKVSKVKALELFNDDELRIVEIDNGKKWFLPGFIEFQYGHLSDKNRAHLSVISILKKHNLINDDYTLKINKPLTSPLQGGKEKDMDKVKDKDMEMDKENDFEILEQYPFNDFWEMYGKKVGREDCNRKYNKLKESEKSRIFETLPNYVLSKPDKQYRMNPETYLNGKHWNDEIIVPTKFVKKSNIEVLAESYHDNSLQEKYLREEQEEENRKNGTNQA